MHPEFKRGRDKAFDPSIWVWKIVVSFHLRGQHISVHELKAILAIVRWWCRSLAAFDCHWLHLSDSQLHRCFRCTFMFSLVSTRRMHPPDGAAFSFVVGRDSSSTCGTAAFTWQVEGLDNNSADAQA
eukprot:2398812-Amphidinium_carterae.1